MKLRHERETLGGLLSKLVEDTRKHIPYEESLMSDQECPDYAKHRAEDGKLMQHVVDLERQYRGGHLLLSFAIVLELKGWATNSIEHNHKRLGAFLNGKSVY